MERVLSDMQRLFLEALFDEAALPAALQSFAGFCGASVSQLMIGGAHKSLLQSSFSREFDPALLAKEATYQHINPRVAAIPLMKVGKATRDFDFISTDAIKRDVTYQEMIFPLGLEHFSGVPIIKEEALIIGLALHQPKGEEAISNDQASRQELAAEACASVFHLALRIKEREQFQVLEMLGHNTAVAIIDSEGRLVDFNSAFEETCRRHEIVARKRSDVLQQISSRYESLRRAIQFKSGTVRLRTDELGFPRLVCSVMPLPASRIAAHIGGVALAVLREPRSVQQYDLVSLQLDTSLTDAEAETVALIAIGLSTEEISHRRGVSVNTTRSLLKRSLAKTGCRSRAEIASLASFYRN